MYVLCTSFMQVASDICAAIGVKIGSKVSRQCCNPISALQTLESIFGAQK